MKEFLSVSCNNILIVSLLINFILMMGYFLSIKKEGMEHGMREGTKEGYMDDMGIIPNPNPMKKVFPIINTYCDQNNNRCILY